jgi:hypothetical protein
MGDRAALISSTAKQARAHAPPDNVPLRAPMRTRRQFMELVEPSGSHPGLLHAILARHAEPLVAHLLAALAAASASDADMCASLLDALCVVCGAAHFLPEMAADR